MSNSLKYCLLSYRPMINTSLRQQSDDFCGQNLFLRDSTGLTFLFVQKHVHIFYTILQDIATQFALESHSPILCRNSAMGPLHLGLDSGLEGKWRGSEERISKDVYTLKVMYNNVLPCERFRTGDSTLHIITTRYRVMQIHRNMGEKRRVDVCESRPVIFSLVPLILKLV